MSNRLYESRQLAHKYDNVPHDASPEPEDAREEDRCLWCNDILPRNTESPYCSLICSINATSEIE